MGPAIFGTCSDAATAKDLLHCVCTDTNALNSAVFARASGPAPFPRCPWAVDLRDKPFPGRKKFSSHGGTRKAGTNLGGWFWESGFNRDPIADVEWMRDQNFRAMYGAWDVLKNVDQLYPNQQTGLGGVSLPASGNPAACWAT